MMYMIRQHQSNKVGFCVVNNNWLSGNQQEKPTVTNMQRISNLPTQHSEELQCEAETSECSDFSFNRARTMGSEALKQKYADIYNDLRIMQQSDLIDLLLEELEENENCKAEVSRAGLRVIALKHDNEQLKQDLRKKREAIELLCQAEDKNAQVIEKLQNKLSRRSEQLRDTFYEQKYQELSVHMNEYIRSMNQAQEEFMRAYSTLKADNSRLHQQIQRTSGEYDQLVKRYQVLGQRVRKYEVEVSELGEAKNQLICRLTGLLEENELLRKEVEIFQENMRITDKLELHVESERHQISSELDFIKEKICESQNMSRDIIEKLQQNSSDCDRITREKSKCLEALQREKERVQALDKENADLYQKNDELTQDICILRKELEYVCSERDDLEEEILQQKIQKESIRRELVGLGEKVRHMESTFRKEIEQSEKIKGELCKFWESKEKKENSLSRESGQPRALAEIKPNIENSQTTISISERESKLSVRHLKSEDCSSGTGRGKENYGECKDSICE